jgi:UDPglucose 6-dehydrogenase
MEAVRKRFGAHAQLELVDDPYAAAVDADALILVTEWRQYWAPDFARLSALMRQAVIIDGRNIWPPDVVRARGFTYYSIGRP